MENQDGHIPEHLKAKWEEVEQELSVASEEICSANRRYNEAILARIALNLELKQWQMKTYFGVDFKP